MYYNKVGEISIHVEEFKVLTKTLRPLPLPKVDSEGMCMMHLQIPKKIPSALCRLGGKPTSERSFYKAH